MKNYNLIPRKFVEAVWIKNKSFNEVQEAIADASENKSLLKDEESIFELNISPEISSRVLNGRPQDRIALQSAVSKKQLALFTTLSMLPSQKYIENKMKSTKLSAGKPTSITNNRRSMTTATNNSNQISKQKEKVVPVQLDTLDRILK